MDWIEVTVRASQEGIDPVCAVLDGLGLDQVSIVDGTPAIRRELETVESTWDYVDYEELKASMGEPSVRLYLSNSEDGQKQLEDIRTVIHRLRDMDLGLDPGTLEVVDKIVGDENWNELWKRYFTPIPVGDRLLIQPAWEDIPAEYAGRIPIRLQNSAIFGTGQHASTQLSLELLSGGIRPGNRILDIGCGSGVLFIAALLLGGGNAVAVDVDAKARQIVPEHADLNGIDEDRFRVIVGDAVASDAVADAIGQVPFDIVIANIVTDVILPLTPNVTRWIRPGGLYVMSGIIYDRLPEILDGLAASGFVVEQALRQGDWMAVSARYTADRD